MYGLIGAEGRRDADGVDRTPGVEGSLTQTQSVPRRDEAQTPGGHDHTGAIDGHAALSRERDQRPINGFGTLTRRSREVLSARRVAFEEGSERCASYERLRVLHGRKRGRLPSSSHLGSNPIRPDAGARREVVLVGSREGSAGR